MADGLRSSSRSCSRWRQDRLLIGEALQSHRFVPEPAGELQLLAEFPSQSELRVFHRTFVLALDAGEPISLFYGNGGRTCFVDRDEERKRPLLFPVFFLGQRGEPVEILRANAESVAFAPSASLDQGMSFSDVSFRLRRGGSRFNEIRPFFRCGLPGLLICESACPADSDVFGAALVALTLERKFARGAAPAEAEEKPGTGQAPPQPPPAKTNEPVPQQTTSSAAQTHRLVLSFQRKSGARLPARDVLAAEENIVAEGVPFSVSRGSLTADLEETDFKTAGNPDYLKKLFRRHEVLAVKQEGDDFLLTVEPLYLRATDLVVKILDAAQEPVRHCNIALDVSADRRLGKGWSKVDPQERVRGLIFTQTGGAYKLEPPGNIQENELLISTAEPGTAARLSNVAPRCELEPRPLVSAEELRTGEITRSVIKSAPILIALISSDSKFADTLTPPAVDGFWNEALKLIGGASGAYSWAQAILARAQAPGADENTTILQTARNGSLANEAERDRIVAQMKDGSEPYGSGPRIFLKIRPIERFHLGIALRLIRHDAQIEPATTVGEETLLLIFGSVKSDGSYFCLHPVRRDAALWARPQWLKQARKVFALEVWDNGAVEAMRKLSRVQPAENAPEGVFQCEVPEAGSGRIALYGITPQTLESEEARTAAFAFLAAKATAFLKP
ncbi:MAG TPA: hypothetical protein VE986_01170 [Hyphomicrobiales bacterium]|nr:hypothetical protein [Hyphomicrobiales bacterium]